MNRKSQLSNLKVELENLVGILRKDSGCTWLKHFEHCLESADILLENGFEQDQLNDLSTKIRSVYGGMGSFNDYVPPPNTWGNNEYSGKVYDAAMELKVIGRY